MLLGIICVNEALEKWEETKFEQITNAVTEFVQQADTKLEKSAARGR